MTQYIAVQGELGEMQKITMKPNSVTQAMNFVVMTKMSTRTYHFTTIMGISADHAFP